MLIPPQSFAQYKNIVVSSLDDVPCNFLNLVVNFYLDSVDARWEPSIPIVILENVRVAGIDKRLIQLTVHTHRILIVRAVEVNLNIIFSSSRDDDIDVHITTLQIRSNYARSTRNKYRSVSFD